MEMWSDIRRRVLVEGESKRSVMKAYGIHFRTLEKVLAHAESPGYRASRPRIRKKLGPFLGIVMAMLETDKEAPVKQRHTAQRICDRLREEHGYRGGYTVVKDVVREIRDREKEVFVPLEHKPGEAQADFGHAEIWIAGEKHKAAIFVMTLPYSDALFMYASPRECTETFQEGHVRAFEFFGGVAKRISYDNSKIAVIKIGKGRKRTLTSEFLRLKSHHLFKEHFCRVRRPNEKGHVETLVGYGRRNFLVPVMHFESWEACNEHLTDRCRADLLRQLRGKTGTKAERLETDRSAMLKLPAARFEARRILETKVNLLSLVRFDRNDYSVPTSYAYQAVTAVGGIDTVKFVVAGSVVAYHARSWRKGATIYDPIHYLALLERKPGAFDFARPLKDWELPESFAILRRRLEAEWEEKGTREYIKVLRLLERCSIAELDRAIRAALDIGATDSEAVRLLLEAARERPIAAFCLDGRPHLQRVHVADIDLGAYGALVATVTTMAVQP